MQSPEEEFESGICNTWSAVEDALELTGANVEEQVYALLHVLVNLAGKNPQGQMFLDEAMDEVRDYEDVRSKLH